MGKKIIRVVVTLMVLAILGWIIAYSTSRTLQKKYDANSYGRYLLKEDERVLKEEFPIDRIEYSWSLWSYPAPNNDAWGEPSDAFVCSIHIYKLKNTIPENSTILTSKKNYYLLNDSNLKSKSPQFGSQWYVFEKFNVDFFKQYLNISLGTPSFGGGGMKACIDVFYEQKINQAWSFKDVEVPSNVLNVTSTYNIYTNIYAHQDHPIFRLFIKPSRYLNFLLNSKAKIRFEGTCYQNSTKFFIYDEQSLMFATIQLKEVLNFQACQS